MAGETAEERERASVWDAIFRHGPMMPKDAARITGMSEARVNYLMDHEWFTVDGGKLLLAGVQYDAHARMS